MIVHYIWFDISHYFFLILLIIPDNFGPIGHRSITMPCILLLPLHTFELTASNQVISMLFVVFLDLLIFDLLDKAFVESIHSKFKYNQNCQQQIRNFIYSDRFIQARQQQTVGIMIETKCQIDAPISIVRQILLDFENYPKWNPFIVKIVGAPVVQDQINVDILLPGDSSTNHFDPHVLINNTNEFRWIGLLCCSYCFTGEHYFLLNELTPNRTEFRHGQMFAGCLRPLFFFIMESKTLKGFQLMNEALKKRAEQKLTLQK